MTDFQIPDFSAALKNALAEDIGSGDITTNAIIPSDTLGEFVFVAREDLRLCGLPIMQEIFKTCDVELIASECDALKAGAKILKIKGNTRYILTHERVALNFLQHLSGIATITAKYVAELAGTNTKILDTRKTTPGLRALEKYAVRVGGGENHRMGLYDMVMIKDNHIAAAGGIATAIEIAKKQNVRVEIECDTLAQVEEALRANPDIIMLDNMNLQEMRSAVKLVNGAVKLEASGGVTLQRVRKIAETGVDYISTSKITQSANSVDIALDSI